MTTATPKTAGEILDRSRAFLAAKGVEGARLDAELLVAASLELDRLGLFLALDRPVVQAEVDRARDALVRRAAGEPTAYILGKREFYGRNFSVGTGVLIPRPETELLIDHARRIAAEQIAAGLAEPRIVDLGTGSGCIAITMALEIESARVFGVDLSKEALEIARANGAALEVPTDRFGLSEGDAFEVMARVAPGGVDLLLSNPPYIDPAQPTGLEADVLKYEPKMALFSPQGDRDYWAKRLMKERASLLAEGGRCLVELGFDQSERLQAMASRAGLEIQIHEDLAGIPRLLEFGR